MVTLSGSKYRSSRQSGSRAEMRRGAKAVLCGVVLATAPACSDLDPGNESYCDVNAGVGEECSMDPPREPPVDGWWCLDQTPTPLPLPRPNTTPVALALTVVEWGTRASMAGTGLTASLCLSIDPTCARPLATPYIVEAGTLGGKPLPELIAKAGLTTVPVFEGFDGFVRFTVTPQPGAVVGPGTAFIPQTYYLGGSISGDMTLGGSMLMIQQGLIQNIVTNSFPSVDPAAALSLGGLAFGVYDCDGQPVGDARIELSVASRSPTAAVPIPFQLPLQRIPIAQDPTQPLYTSSSGLAGYINVPQGTVELRAYRRGDSQPFGTVQLNSVAGEISVGTVNPDYVLDANLPAVPPLEPAVPAGN